MDNIETLIERFVDDRDQLSDEELDELVDAAGDDPLLAARLKDQLVIDELLAQRLAIDRRDFVAQMGQRIRDDQYGIPEPAPVDAEMARDIRVLVDVQLAEKQQQARRRQASRWRWVVVAFALMLLAGTGVWWWQVMQQPIGVIAEVTGIPSLARGSRWQPISEGMTICSGDRLSTLPDQSLTLRYRDGTILQLAGDSSVDLQGESSRQGKRVNVAWGTLIADVAQQPAGRPMLIETPISNITVRGTRLWLSADDARTRLDVIEGLVEMARKSDGKSVDVREREYAVATPAALSVEPLTWPIDHRDAVVVLETADTQALVRAGGPEKFEMLDLRPRGQARLDHNFAFVLAGGAYGLHNASAAVLDDCQTSGELTIEATITPDHNKQTGPARIIACSTKPDEYNFALCQQDNQLLFRLRTSDAMSGEIGDIELCRLSAGQPQHVVVTYQPGELVCYLNGRRVYHDGKLQGDFDDWQRWPINLGDEHRGGHDWAGTLQGLAIYDRALGEDEVRRNAEQYRSQLDRRHKVPQVEVVGTLLETSPIPQPSEIAPAPAALVMCRYRVDEVLRGDLEAGDVLVLQWAVLDGQPQPIATAQMGSQRRMTLERFGLNTQLETIARVDEFSQGDDPNKPRYVDVSRP